MGKTNTEFQVKIKYRIGGSENQFVFWDLWKADGVTRLPVADGGWNGVKGTRKQAEKEAQHYARLAEQKLERNIRNDRPSLVADPKHNSLDSKGGSAINALPFFVTSLSSSPARILKC